MANYADTDHRKIADYIEKHGGTVAVGELIGGSGCEPLRVYPLIQRMMLAGELKIMKTDAWGAPLVVKNLQRFKAAACGEEGRTGGFGF